ncbi:MAG: hypothetical protein QM775_26845 [Pirellulales bacterium]
MSATQSAHDDLITGQRGLQIFDGVLTHDPTDAEFDVANVRPALLAQMRDRGVDGPMQVAQVIHVSLHVNFVIAGDVMMFVDGRHGRTFRICE